MSILEDIKTKFGNKARSWDDTHPGRIYINVSPEDIPGLSGILYSELNMRFMVISGIDTPDSIELLYHFADDPSGQVITLRALLIDKEKPEIKTLTGFIKGSSWIEREIHELLGVNFIGHPNQKHLLLGDDWPKGNYPLRHDND